MRILEHLPSRKSATNKGSDWPGPQGKITVVYGQQAVYYLRVERTLALLEIQQNHLAVSDKINSLKVD